VVGGGPHRGSGGDRATWLGPKEGGGGGTHSLAPRERVECVDRGELVCGEHGARTGNRELGTTGVIAPLDRDALHHWRASNHQRCVCTTRRRSGLGAHHPGTRRPTPPPTLRHVRGTTMGCGRWSLRHPRRFRMRHCKTRYDLERVGQRRMIVQPRRHEKCPPPLPPPPPSAPVGESPEGDRKRTAAAAAATGEAPGDAKDGARRPRGRATLPLGGGGEGTRARREGGVVLGSGAPLKGRLYGDVASAGVAP